MANGQAGIIQIASTKPGTIQMTFTATSNAGAIWKQLLPSAFSLLAAMVFMLTATLLYWPSPEIAFRTDESPVAWLSSAQMWGMALLALRLARDSILPRTLCFWLALAMAGMAFDEQFMLHEHWKYGCIDWFAQCRHAWVTELPMFLVGALGVATALWLHKSLPQRPLQALLWAALCVGLFALWLRFGGSPAELLPYKAALLVLAQALFAGMLLGIPTKW